MFSVAIAALTSSPGRYSFDSPVRKFAPETVSEEVNAHATKEPIIAR
jgi:hypothetical protein